MDTNTLTQVASTAAHVAEQANSAASLNTLVISIVGFFGILVTTIGAVFMAKINANQKGFSQKIDKVESTTTQIHRMVNQPFGEALGKAAGALQTVSDMNPDRDDYRDAAKIAKAISEDHKTSMAAFEMAERVADSAKVKVQVVSKPEAVTLEKGATVLVVDPVIVKPKPETEKPI